MLRNFTLPKVLILCLLISFGSAASAFDLVVAKDGSGNYTTVQAAINAAPSNSLVPFVIFIKNGKYKEKITISKPFIQLVGQSVANVILTFDDYGGKTISCGSTVGTQNSASVTVNANDFAATNITFENSHQYGTPDNNNQQAVAILVNGDRAAFKNCRFIGNQDTMYLKGSGAPRQYFRNCYIDGLTDYIFGSSIAVFDSCVLYDKNRAGIVSSYMTAANTTTGQAYGFVFRNSKIEGNDGGTKFYLGRPWQNNPKVVYLNATIINAPLMLPAGWSTTSAGSATLADSYFAEFMTRNSDGSLTDVSQRTPGTHQLTNADTVGYNLPNMFSGWDPCSVAAGFCTSSTADIAVSNFRITQGNPSLLEWNISWPMSGIQYSLYRSVNNTTFSQIYTMVAPSDTSVNYSYIEPAAPPIGGTYYYYVTASKAGLASHTTDTLKISNASSITVNAPDNLFYCGFSQALGTPSASQTYTVSATWLTNNLTITAPANFEVSLNNSTWNNSSNPLIISPSGGSVTTTTVYVRLNAPLVGSYSGNVVNASVGTTSVNVPVTGNTAAPPTSFVLQAWGLTQNNNDSVLVRSAAVTPASATLHNINTSDGSAASANIPSYSGQYGQALGSNAAGNNWSAVGGTLKRDYYEQFTITANNTSSLRIDSIGFLSAFYLTTSNIKMAVAYSKNGFIPSGDSAEITNGVGSGGSLVTSTSGNFSRSFPILRDDNGPAAPIDYYGLALNGNTGVSLVPGQTLTIRLYWACGSSGIPRFAFLKNVVVKGQATSAAPLAVSVLNFNGTINGHVAHITWQANNENNLAVYQLEKSNDGRNFTVLNRVNPTNTMGTSSYISDDNNLQQGVNFYRLKVIDLDGQYKFSPVIALNYGKAAPLAVFPNPVKDNLFVMLPKAQASAKIVLYSADGRKINEYAVSKDAMQMNINTNGLASGNYHIVFVNGSDLQSISFIKN